jgi:5-methylcytosine-specific restriction protein B
MNGSMLDKHIREELRILLERGSAAGTLITPEQIARHMKTFSDQFGPEQLQNMDGEALLLRMHGRINVEAKCLAYWLEFKDDDEFAGKRFGRIGGGSALMFGLFQRQSDGAWIAGSSIQQKVLTLAEAIEKVRKQRDELLAGDRILSAFDPNDTSDEAYSRLQTAMTEAAPELSGIGWAHKYWFLLHSDLLDDYHSPRYQRFHLLKLLQMPPDRAGVRDGGTPRFVCAGRFIAAAREFGVPVTTFATVLNERHGAFHRYWRIGTTEGSNSDSQWPAMRDGSCILIGWGEQVSDLSTIIGQKDAKLRIRDVLTPIYQGNLNVAARKAGEILNFAQEIAENDLVLACEGQTVRGVGRVRGAYDFDSRQRFPHKQPVEWLLLEEWSMPQLEGLRTTVFELGKSAENLLELERRLHASKTKATEPPQGPGPQPLTDLDPTAKRVENILRRKGQVIFYGPPGTGKTFQARRVARELASRSAYGKNFSDLDSSERNVIEGDGGLVRLCTFHPGYGYEDFIERLRPRITAAESMVFEPRDGIFKTLCRDASKPGETRQFFLIVDEINRGDVPRIFGELITVIELDKRGTRILLPITGTPFSVPPNVSLIGTMNTADRSISLLDAALRRRFGFVELLPDSTPLAGRKAGTLPLGPWLEALNERLRKHLKRDARNLQIGHAYLLPPQPITSMADFARVLRDDIIPLIEEYCYDDFQTLGDILDRKLVDVDGGRVRDELFAPNREEDLIQAIWFEQMGPRVLETSADAEQTFDDTPEEEDGVDAPGSEA